MKVFQHKKLFLVFLPVLLGVWLMLYPSFAHAAIVNCGNSNNGSASDSCKWTDLFSTATDLITYLLSGAAVVAVGGVVYGGYLMVTSAGNPTKSGAGKKAVANSMIGLVIILGAVVLERLPCQVLGCKDVPLIQSVGVPGPAPVALAPSDNLPNQLNTNVQQNPVVSNQTQLNTEEAPLVPNPAVQNPPPTDTTNLSQNQNFIATEPPPVFNTSSTPGGASNLNQPAPTPSGRLPNGRVDFNSLKGMAIALVDIDCWGKWLTQTRVSPVGPAGGFR